MQKIYLILLLTFSLLTKYALGQEANNLFKFTGDCGLYADFYNMDSEYPGAIAARRPGTLSRMVFNASISVKDFSMPISVIIPFQQYSSVIINTPAIPNTPLVNFIRNPQNRVGIAPKYKWIQLLLGSQIPVYSELSTGDLPVFGVGFNLTPGKFRFSSFAGTSQWAVEENDDKDIQGIYTRKMYFTKVGYGHEDSSHVYLIGCMLKDDTSTLNFKPIALMPQAGISTSIDFRVNFGKRAYVKGEIAGTAYTRDTRANDLPEFRPSLPELVYVPKESSRSDLASIVTFGSNWKNFGLTATGRYYGDGYVSLGYPYLQTDRAEVTIDPRFILFKSKMQLSGSIGKRVNNLSGIRAATTTQTIGSMNINMQFSEKLSLSATYANYGFRNSIVNDTFKVELVTISWSISPSYNIIGEKSVQNFTIMYSQNTFKDFNTVSGELNDNDASNGVFTYSISMIKNPLSISSLASYFSNNTSYGKLLNKSLNISAGYKFMEKKLNTLVGLTIADNKLNDEPSGVQVTTILGIKYTMKKKMTFALNGSINIFEYGTSRPGISYREDLLRTSVTYKI